MHASYLLIIISREMTTSSSAAASSLLGRKDLEWGGPRPGRDDEQDLNLRRLGGLQNGLNTPNTVDFFWIRPGQNIIVVFKLRPVF